MEGWIKLHRKLLCSPVWNEPGMLKLWIYCLAKAAHKETEVLIGHQLVKLKPGQFITGRNSLYNDINKGVKPANQVSAITLWRRLKVLEKMSNLVLETNNKYTLVTIVKWEDYQGNGEKMNRKRTTNEQQMNTNKNDKNDKNKNIGDFFENIWSLYPNKKGKGKISEKQKERLYKLGFDTLKTCIDRYKKSKEDWQKWQHGSTFFNSGYVDYLDENYQEQKEPSPYRPAAEIMEERRRRNAL